MRNENMESGPESVQSLWAAIEVRHKKVIDAFVANANQADLQDGMSIMPSRCCLGSLHLYWAMTQFE